MPDIGRADRALRTGGCCLAGAVLALVIVTPFLGHRLDRFAGVTGSYVPVGDLVVDVCIAAVALVVVIARPRNAVGWLMATFAALGALQNAAEAYGVRAQADPTASLPLGRLALSIGTSIWIAAFYVPAVLLVNLYPDGRTAARRWVWVNRIGGVATVLAVIAAATSHGMATGDYRGAHQVIELPKAAGAALGIVGGVALVVCIAASLTGAVVRTVRARAPERQQLVLLLTAAVLLVPLGMLTTWTRAIGLVLVPVAVAIGVLRYRLLGIEVVLRRTLIYGVLTGLVIGVYAAVTAAGDAIAASSAGSRVVAAALVAVLLVPLRDRLQRGVDWIVYGARRDPLLAVTRLGSSMASASADPMAAVAAAVARAVRASSVTIRDVDGVVLAVEGTAHGRPVQTRPLSVGGELIGELGISPAPGEHALTPADARVVDVLTPPVAVVVHATLLTQRLAAAHERALAATQDERARIRRDLHDGLGPSLAGVHLGIEALESALDSDVRIARELSGRIKAEVQAAVGEVRRILDALRPAVLDELGLVAAIRARATAISERSNGLQVGVQPAAGLPELPPGHELAAFRIVDEALTNVVRHARARHCTIRIDVYGPEHDTVGICVEDDGVGMAAENTSDGVGLASIVARARELGGAVEIGRAAMGGMRIEVRLPLPVAGAEVGASA